MPWNCLRGYTSGLSLPFNLDAVPEKENKKKRKEKKKRRRKRKTIFCGPINPRCSLVSHLRGEIFDHGFYRVLPFDVFGDLPDRWDIPTVAYF